MVKAFLKRDRRQGRKTYAVFGPMSIMRTAKNVFGAAKAKSRFQRRDRGFPCQIDTILVRLACCACEGRISLGHARVNTTRHPPPLPF